MEIYGLKNCDTCRKAEKSLRTAGYNPETIDVRADGIPEAELVEFLNTFGEALVNRRSTTWRNLPEEQRALDPAVLLTTHPTLMKRPVIRHDGQLYLGWGKDVEAALLG